MFTKTLHINTQMSKEDKALLAFIIREQLAKTDAIKLNKKTLFHINDGAITRPVQLSNSIIKRRHENCQGHEDRPDEYLIIGNQTDSNDKQKRNSGSRHPVKHVLYIISLDDENNLDIRLGNEVIKCDEFIKENKDPYNFAQPISENLPVSTTKENNFDKWRQSINEERDLTNLINTDANCHCIFRPKLKRGSHRAKAYLTMTRYEGETLNNVPLDALTLSDRLYAGLDYLKQVQAIHEKNIVYADPKADNTILDPKTLTLKTIDFDNSFRVGNKGGCAGTYNYYPPELTDGKYNSIQSDTFVAAAVAAEILTCDDLFINRKRCKNYMQASKQDFNFANLLAKYRDTRYGYEQLDEHIFSLQFRLKDMSKQDPEERCSLDDAIKDFENVLQYYLRKDFKKLDEAIKATIEKYQADLPSDPGKRLIVNANIDRLTEQRTAITEEIKRANDAKIKNPKQSLSFDIQKYRQIKQNVCSLVDDQDIAKALGYNRNPVRRFFNGLSKYTVIPVLRLITILVPKERLSMVARGLNSHWEHGIMPAKSLQNHQASTQIMRDFFASSYPSLRRQKW